MFELQSGRITRQVLRLLNIKAGQGALASLAPDLQAVMVADPPALESRYLQGELLAEQFYSIAAGGAGQYGQVMLNNPADSRRLGVLEAVWIYNGTGAACTWYIATVVGVSGGTDRRPGYLRDTRWGSAVVPVLGCFSALVGAVTATALPVRIASDGWAVVPYDAVVGPAGNVRVLCGTANVASVVGFRWRERPAEDGELIL